MECGISLSELARASGISKGECSKVENGKANVTLGTLKAMGAALALQLRVEIQEVVR
jgi:transcriptional regulator with XRE-family HTH domain